MTAFWGGPDAVLMAICAGFLLICLECNRPGWIVPGCLGCLIVMLAFHELTRWPLNFFALVLAGAGLSMTIASTFVDRNVVAYVGVLALAVGLRLLIQQNGLPHVHLSTAILCAAVTGTALVRLGRMALMARRNKRQLRTSGSMVLTAYRVD